MHIVIIHQAFASIHEAGGTRHHELARALAEQGHRVSIIASSLSYLTGTGTGSDRVEKDGDSITIFRVPTYNRLHQNFVQRVISFFSFMFSSFFKGLQLGAIDLVWGTSPPIFQGFTAWLLARIKRARFLFEIRDLWPAFAIAVGVLRNRFLILLSNWLERFLYSHADLVVVNSPGFIDHVKAHGGKDVRLVPNGASISMFDDTSGADSFRREHDLAGKTVITYAGAHGLSNDLEVVLRAAQQLLHDERIHFLFVGDGKEKKNLQSLAQQNGLRNILFLPSVAKEEMSTVLAASDACLAILKPLELYKTTYPNKVFDYMAAARPVILSIDGVIREVVEDAQAGIFCQPGQVEPIVSACIYFADHPEQGKQMGLNGRKYVAENYSREKIAQELISIVNEMRN